MPKPTFHNLRSPKRQRIIDAAIEEFGSRPYRQATLDRIVVTAGVSKGSMYQYFNGKADLYGWLVTSYMADRKMAALDADAPYASGTLWGTLEHWFLAGVQFAIAEPGLTRLGVRFHRDQDEDEDLVEIAAELQARSDAAVSELVLAARERGELRADVDLAMFVGLLSYALGVGMLDLIARRLQMTTQAFLDHPEHLQTLHEDDLRALVRGAIALFRHGAEPPAPD